jgi:hypothetical protein
LVLGGADLDQGEWRVRLLIRYYTALSPAPDPCRAQRSKQLVPGETVIIVGCFNGGSDGESFVAVLGFHPGLALPEVLLSADCGDTDWQLHGNRLIILSSDLKSGAAYPGSPHPDISITWSGEGAFGSLSPRTNGDFSNFMTFCRPANPSNA